MKIKVDVDALKKESGNILDSVDKYNKGINNLKSTKNGIAGIWQGNDYNYFSSQMDSFANELINYSKTIESYAEFLKEYAEKHEKLDNEYAGKAIELE